MKLGILTLPLWNNYGGILQAYTLQETLKSLGHEVVLLDYHHNISNVNLVKNRFKRFIKYHILQKRDNAYYPNPIENKHISQHTLNFIRNEFDQITKRLFTESDLKEATESLDGVIVGSDQVWRPNYTPDIKNYFLQFVPEKKLKIAYAASLGTDKWLFSEEETEVCKSLLKKFNSVSVREDSALNLVKEKLGNEAVQVVDPTMLLESQDYLKLVRKYPYNKDNKGKIFTYILDNNKNVEEFVTTVSKKLGKETFSSMPKHFDVNFSFNKEEYIFPPLTNWVKSFDEADFILVDSFHGCVFAIIFNKPFITIGNPERGMTRFYSLLKLFDLENRLVKSTEDFDFSLLHEEIDWRKVNSILTDEKEKALSFLVKSLSNES